jgi:hypothetical protein
MVMTMTPADWRDELSKELVHEAGEVQTRRRWRDGPHPWPTPPTALRAVMTRLCELAETNLCGLAVDAVSERLAVAGMRVFGDGRDAELWSRIWQANHLDADSTDAHREALTTESAYVLVTHRDGADPLITVEEPCECVVEYAPGDRRTRVAALKRFVDERSGYVVATVWTPDEVWTWRAPYRASDVTGPGQRLQWEEHPDYPGGPNPFGVVPLVEIRCDGELGHKVTTLQRRINMTMFRLITIGEFQIVPQRYAIGITVDTDVDGNAVNPMQVGEEHVWILDAEDPSKAQIGQLEPANIEPIMKLLEGDVTRFGAITKTPLYYVAGGLVNVSADAIRAAEAGLIAKVGRTQLKFGQAWEEVYKLALVSIGIDPPADIETQWADPESRSLAERADAALKLKAAGYPFSAVARKMGETETEIGRLRAEIVAEAGAPALSAPAAP